MTERLFAEMNRYLADQGITLRSGMLVDAIIIDASSSTKNEARAHHPEMSSTKKGNDWFCGVTAHVGVDADSGASSIAWKPRPRKAMTVRSGTTSRMSRKTQLGTSLFAYLKTRYHDLTKNRAQLFTLFRPRLNLFLLRRRLLA